MEVSEFFLKLLVIIISAKFFAEVFAHLRLPSVLGQKTRMAQQVLRAAVLDDLFGVVVLAVLYNFAVKGAVSVVDTVKILVFIIAFILTAPVIAKMFVPMMDRLSNILYLPRWERGAG